MTLGFHKSKKISKHTKSEGIKMVFFKYPKKASKLQK
jgi:hypothetical protein